VNTKIKEMDHIGYELDSKDVSASGANETNRLYVVLWFKPKNENCDETDNK
jgi:hypothetical protein